MSWIKIPIKIFIVMLVTLCCLALIEVCVRTYNHNVENHNYEEWIESKPEAFRNVSNFGAILKSLDGTCKAPALLHENGVSIFSQDFSCGGITYLNNKRLTLPTISEWEKTIHLFGGSTVYGVGAVDAFTIPSIIQTVLLSNQVRVLNYGFSSFTVENQNNTLLALKNDVRKGDVVIYYDGGNDFWNGVMLGNLGGDIIGYNKVNKYQLYIFILKGWLSRNSETYRLLSDLKHGRHKIRDECSVDSEIALQRLVQAATHYSNKINEARIISEKLGAKFLHFYQPTLFDSEALTLYEEKILSFNPCWALAMPFKKKYDKVFLEASKDSVDLSNILAGKDLFFDYIHTSSQANQLVSEAIVEHIIEK